MGDRLCGWDSVDLRWYTDYTRKADEHTQNEGQMKALKEMMSGDAWWGPLTLIMLIALIGFGSYALAADKSMDGANLVIGGLMTNMGMLLSFRYGSSKGSKDKDKQTAP